MSSVFQPWFSRMGWKMQSIFVNGLRAPDVATESTKKAVRWMRTKACNDADPTKPNCYMTAPGSLPISDCVDELEYLPCHYVHHLADSMRILALFHPDPDVKNDAFKLHYLIAEEIFHFVPEDDETFLQRHRDKVDHA